MSQTTFGSSASSSESIGLHSDLETANGTIQDNATTTTMTNLNLEFVPGESKSKNTEWIEEFLTHYVNYNTPHTYNKDREDGDKTAELEKKDTQNIVKRVIVSDFEIDLLHPPSHDLQAVLSDIFSLKVRYQAHEENGDKMDKNEENQQQEHQEETCNFIVKVPPTNVEDRQLSALAQVDHREIQFYTKVIPDIRTCCLKNNVKMDLGIVNCFHAHYDRPLEELPVEGVIENLSKAESIIVLEDLRPKGFSKRNFIDALSLSEVKAAVRELAKIHAHSWIVGQLSGQELQNLWPFYYKPEDATLLYEALLEDGFPILVKHLKELVAVNKDYEAEMLIETLNRLQKQGLRSLLMKLFNPSANLTTIVHMDFWSDNLFFKTGNGDESNPDSEPNLNDNDNDDYEIPEDHANDNDNIYSEDNNKESSSSNRKSKNLQCRILDWQMMSLGRPTHDLALLLFTSLPAKQRKENLDKFLQFYLKIFQATVSKFPTISFPSEFDLSMLKTEYENSKVLAILQVIASIDLALIDNGTQERLFDALEELEELKI